MDNSKSEDETNLLLKEILVSLQRIELLLSNPSNQGEVNINNLKPDLSLKSKSPPLDVMELIDVLSKKDEHLIPTIKALISSNMGRNAQEIAEITKRSRSRENQHLNKLVELGYAQKRREGREILFFLSH